MLSCYHIFILWYINTFVLSFSHTLLLSYPLTPLLSYIHTLNSHILVLSYTLTLLLSHAKPPTSGQIARVRPPRVGMRLRFRALVIS